MKTNKKNSIFVCQLSESSIKLIKCLFSDNSKRQFVGLETEKLSADITDKELTDKLARQFRKLGYSQNQVIISLPRSKVATRFLKVPTQIPSEIDKIVSLQASRYLPYSTEELITGYQVLFSDTAGFSQINLIIVHKDVVQRYVRIFKEIKCIGVDIILSSYGLVNFYDFLYPNTHEAVMILDIDYQQVELAIFSRKKLLFSRYFKLDPSQPNWENTFIDEVSKTQDVYSKDPTSKAVVKIFLTGAGKTYQEFAQALHKNNPDLAVEALTYEKINFSKDLLSLILTSEDSFASLIGLGLKSVEKNLTLLPQDIKERGQAQIQHKQRLQLTVLVLSLFLLLGLGIAKNLDNKAKYVKQLKLELNKVSKEALVLEEIEKRLQLMRQHSEKELSSLDLIYALHQTIPEGISLVGLTYEEEGHITLRGQTPELNSVFAFVEKLEKSSVFKDLAVKVRYATQKRMQAGTIVDFEIICSKK